MAAKQSGLERVEDTHSDRHIALKLPESVLPVRPFQEVFALRPTSRKRSRSLCVVFGFALAVGVVLPGQAVAQRQNEKSDSATQLYPVKTDSLVVVGRGPFFVHRFIVPGTEFVVLDGVALDSTAYGFSYGSGTIILHSRPDSLRSLLVVRYSFLPVDLKEQYRRRVMTRRRDKKKQGRTTISKRASSGGDDNARSPGMRLNRSGSITRGITTGSRRDVAIESGLRLQVDGELVDGVRLKAVLTDENTPILPEGTTQRLNEFDRVFIELSSKRGAVQLGDIDGRFSTGRYGQLNRKLQGASVRASIPANGPGFFRGASVSVAGATSRGVFRSQPIQAIDGVQGPYRLEGDNLERFIIVIPGSESVFLDGDRLVRGESKDYVIDYTTGEIRFTPSNIITAERRISVEFQYTTNQFTRTLLATSIETGFGGIRNGLPLISLGASLIRESDGDQFSQEFALTAADSLAIMTAGDGVAFRSGAIQVPYDPEALFTQYRRETRVLSDGSTDSVFVALTGRPVDTEPVFRVTFTRRETGEGSYRRVGQSINGIVYEYTGRGSGEYAPVRTLPKPRSQSLFNITSVLRPLDGLSLNTEWATSRKDLNRLSFKDSGDDAGNAYEINLTYKPGELFLNDHEIGRLSISATSNLRNDTFNTFERIRPIEFLRDWNLRDRSTSVAGSLGNNGSERLDRLAVRLDRTDSTAFGVDVSTLSLGTEYSGSRVSGDVNLRLHRFPRITYSGSSVSADDHQREIESTWEQHSLRLTKPLHNNNIRPYANVSTELLREIDLTTGEHQVPGFKAVTSAVGSRFLLRRWTVSGDVSRRDEERRLSPTEKGSFQAWTLRSNADYHPGNTFRGSAEVGYRKTTAPDGRSDTGGLVPSGNSDALILRLSGRWNTTRRDHVVNWLYQAQTERSATLQEIYIRTGQERGEFIWFDENGDGAIQIEEFVPETTPDEGNYVRTFIPSDSLESVTSVKGRIRWDYHHVQEGKSNRTLLKGIGLSTLVDFEEKSRDPIRSRLYLLRLDRFRNSVYTLNGRIRFRQELSFFRNTPGRDLTIVFQDFRSLTELSAGEESKRGRLIELRSSSRLGRLWTITLRVLSDLNQTNSQSFSSRSFSISEVEVNPSVSVRVGEPVVLTFDPRWSKKSEKTRNASASVLMVPIQARYSVQSRFDVVTRIEIAHVSLDRTLRGLTAFEMTDGRGAGTSALWRLSVQANLTDVLTATLSYDGRAPSGASVINTARFQLNARF